MKFEVRPLFKNGSKYNYLFINPYPVNLDEEMMNYLYFNVKTYSKLSTTELAVEKLNPIPDFVDKLTNLEREKLINMFIEIKKFTLINQDKSIEIITTATGEIIFESFNDLNLIEKLRRYVIDNHVPIPDLSQVGKRPHDNKKTTFYHNEYIDLTTIALICKLLSGVFGEIIFLVSNINSAIDNSLKEIYALFSIKKILDQHFKKLVDKLVFYIETYMNKVNSGEDLNSLIKGYDKSKIKLSVYSIIIIKKFVNIDLYDPGQNIMIYIYRCINKTLESLSGSLKKKNITMERYSSSNIFSDSESDDDDILEDESSSFNTTFDIPILIRHAANQLIKEVSAEFDPILYKKVHDYYLYSALSITPINELIVAIFLSSHIGSAYCINQLKIQQYISLVTILQLKFVNHEKYKPLTHLISLSSSYKLKEFMTQFDNKICINKGVGYSFRLIKDNFKHIGKEINWNGQINRIIDFLTRYENFNNTCPEIYRMLDAPVKNGDIVEYNEFVITLIYDYVFELIYLNKS